MEKSFARRMPKYVKRSPKKDPQKHLVYFMEADSLGALHHHAKMTRAGIRKFAKSVCGIYQVPQVAVQFKQLDSSAAHWQEPCTLIFNPKQMPWSQSLLIVIHELAHHVHYSLAPEGQQDHGPEWMCCYMDILDAVRVLPYEGMRAVCDKYGVKYADRGNSERLSALKRAVLNYASSHSE